MKCRNLPTRRPLEKLAITMFPMGPTLKDEFPEVLNYSRVDWIKQYEMTYGEKRVFFPQDLLRGYLLSPDVRLPAPERRPANRPAKTKQHRADGIGCQGIIRQRRIPSARPFRISGDDTLLFTVTGILKDVPANSQFQFDALQSLNTIYKPDWMNRWGTMA